MTEHGTWRCYRRTLCARPECLAAWQRYKKGREHARHNGELTRVDSIGTHRRLQGLMFMGYSGRWLAKQIPVSSSGDLVRLMRAPRVATATAEKVRRVYDEYAMTPAPSNRWTTKVRNHARVKGFHSPLSWDDDELDDPNAKPRGLAQRKDGYCTRGLHPKPDSGRCKPCRAEWFAENPDWRDGAARRQKAAA